MKIGNAANERAKNAERAYRQTGMTALVRERETEKRAAEDFAVCVLLEVDRGAWPVTQSSRKRLVRCARDRRSWYQEAKKSVDRLIEGRVCKGPEQAERELCVDALRLLPPLPVCKRREMLRHEGMIWGWAILQALGMDEQDVKNTLRSAMEAYAQIETAREE